MPAKEQSTGEPAGTGGGRREDRLAKITGPTTQGNKRWRQIDNHRADKARKQAPKKNVDWLTDKEAMGRKRQGGWCRTQTPLRV
ncbi:hypothetical protein BY996DRAFT_6436648 [Phakopsora pachyrhizi]|nr:hypothetical protein BY996DRAFT_6436648 [Phakopsora pachyrhizi]